MSIMRFCSISVWVLLWWTMNTKESDREQLRGIFLLHKDMKQIALYVPSFSIFNYNFVRWCLKHIWITISNRMTVELKKIASLQQTVKTFFNETFSSWTLFSLEIHSCWISFKTLSDNTGSWHEFFSSYLSRPKCILYGIREYVPQQIFAMKC